MRETVDGEASPKEEASTSDSRGNYPNGAQSPQSHLYRELEYSPSFLYKSLTAETTTPRAPQAKIIDKWGWTPGYGILHTGPCDRCEGYQQHLATAIGIGVPLAVTAGNYPRDMVQREQNRIWAMMEGAQERNDWTVIQRDGEGEIILGPSIIPEAVRMPCNKEIPLMMSWKDAGSPLSPETIHAALTDNDNMSEGPIPSVLTSNAGEEQPQDGMKATVLHYRHDSVIIICSNRWETVLTSRPCNRDRDPTWIYTSMAAMDAEPLPHTFRYTLNTNNALASALQPLVPADSRACVIVKTLIDGHKPQRCWTWVVPATSSARHSQQFIAYAQSLLSSSSHYSWAVLAAVRTSLMEPMLRCGLGHSTPNSTFVGLVIVHSPRTVSEIAEVLYSCKLSYCRTYSRYPLFVIANNYCLPRHA